MPWAGSRTARPSCARLRRRAFRWWTAAVAGQSGYVATVLPGAKGPADYLGGGAGAEDTLGTPAPAVATAASIMAGEALNMLCGRGPQLAGKMLVFDLAAMSFETVTL